MRRWRGGHYRLPHALGSPGGMPGNSGHPDLLPEPDRAARPDPGNRITAGRQHVSGAMAAGQRDRLVRYQAGTLAITANCAPSGSIAIANLPTPGTSLAETTTIPPFAVTAAAAASQSATSK
jgi:hypothetical protein